MKLIIALNHPSQYHLFKFSYKDLIEKGHKIKFVIKEKDILKSLLINDNLDFLTITKKKVGRTNTFSILFNRFIELLNQDINLFFLVQKFKPNLMIGTDIAITHIGKFFKIPSLVFNEDDFEINKLFCKLSYPFATKIIS